MPLSRTPTKQTRRLPGSRESANTTAVSSWLRVYDMADLPQAADESMGCSGGIRARPASSNF
jgi:hypothetical protein